MQSCSAGRAACHLQIQLNMAMSATFRHLLTFVDWALSMRNFFSDSSRDAARLLHSHCSRRLDYLHELAPAHLGIGSLILLQLRLCQPLPCTRGTLVMHCEIMPSSGSCACMANHYYCATCIEDHDLHASTRTSRVQMHDMMVHRALRLQ